MRGFEEVFVTMDIMTGRDVIVVEFFDEEMDSGFFFMKGHCLLGVSYNLNKNV